MRTAAPSLLPLFRSESQIELLGLLMLQPSRAWTLNELASNVGAPVSSVHRELQRALNAGILVRDADQRPHRYKAATDSPAFEPLSTLLELTVGVPGRLSEALAGVGGVRAAAIHGSWAAGRTRPDSDIDLIVVSDGDRREVQRVVRRVGRAVGRDVDASVMSTIEYSQMRRSQNPFIEKILHGPRVDLIGDVHEVEPQA